ncbi:MAG: hypothetical protein FJ271_08740 [Planctomycetes bacterium]|nr:hypothetical protein [Planctomycetota bacterium]
MSTVQTKPIAKHEVFVEDQLARMRGRIRSLDAGRAILWFFVVTFAYALFAAGLDRLLELPTWVRLTGFIVYCLAALFLAGSVLLSLYRRINPYYAARMLEETLPDAKNSVVNWLDLRDEKLPPVILSALGNRAARDLRKADPEQAVNVGPTWILAGVLAGLVLGVVILFAASPRQFMSLMGRAFAPFQEVGIATRTSISIVEPEGGNATVPPSRPLTIRAAIDGRVPAINNECAPRLHFRYNQADDFAGMPLEQDRDGNYAVTLPADQLLNGGLWYKITANDAETSEFRINVVPTPQVRAFVPAYRYRPYLRIHERSHRYSPGLFAGLKAPRGTEVRLVIHANCPIREGKLRVQWTEGKKEYVDLPGEVLPDDPLAMRFPKLLLDRNGFFHVLFVSKQGERNIDRSAHKIEIIPDLSPLVELKKPEKDVYPANGTVPLEGSARDDFGIKSMVLRLRAHDQGAIHVLEPKPYRPGKSFQLANGKYPDFLEYKDFVSLDAKVTVPLRAVLRDFPDPIPAIIFSPDGKLITLSHDQSKQPQGSQLKLWDLGSGKAATVFDEKPGDTWMMALSPNGKTIATSNGKAIRLWDVDNLKQKGTLKDDKVTSLAFSPDSKMLAAGGLIEMIAIMDQIKLWDLDSARIQADLQGKRIGPVVGVRFAPDGKTLAGLGFNLPPGITLWDIPSGKQRGKLTDKNPQLCVAFSADGMTLASGDDEGKINLWDPAAGKVKAILRGHEKWVSSVAIHGKTLASGSHDRTVRLWDLDTQTIKAVLKGHEADVTCVVFSSDGNTLASASADKTVRLWDVSSLTNSDRIKPAKEQPFALKRGMTLEFWLEAVDNSDYPSVSGNLGKSVAHKILIDEPEKDAKKTKQDQQKAEQGAREHQKNQDQDLERRNKAAREEEQQANNQKTPEQKAQEKKRDELDNQAQKLKDQLNKNDPKQHDKQESKNDKGEAKGTDGPQSDTKKGENNEAVAKENKGDKDQDKPGAQKDAGKQGDEQKPGQARDDGRKDDPKGPKDKNGEAQAKGPGDKSDAGPKGTADKQDSNPKTDKGEDKSAAKQSPEKSSGTAKEQGKDKGLKADSPGQAKQEDPKQKNDPQAKGKEKQAGKEQPDSQAKDDKSGSGGQKSAQDKSEPKKGGTDQAQAKDQDNGKGEQQASAKDKGKDEAGKSGSHGAAKSEDKKEPPSTAKDSPKSGGDKSAAAKAGNDSGKGSGDKSQAKQSNPDDARRSAQAKGDPGAEKAGDREPSLDDVKSAADDLNKQKDPAAQEKAERDLSKIRRNARDPKVRDAADDALQQANRNPARAKKGNGPGEEHQAQAIPKGEGEKGGQEIKGPKVKGDFPSQKPATGKGESGKQDTAQSETKGGETKGGEKAGDFGGGQHGLAGDHKPQAPDQEAGKRGGNLTLEDMKELIKKTSAAERKQAGISDADWQKFKKDVQAYEQALQKSRAQAKFDKTRGGNSKLKSSGPFQVGNGKNDPLEALQGSHFLPPPEFRQAHREFTRGTPSPALPDKK